MLKKLKFIVLMVLGIGVIASSYGHKNFDHIYNQCINHPKIMRERGIGFCQSTVGEYYYRDKNYVKAREWFIKAAKQNEPESQYNLGAFYYNGYGVKRNQATAKQWFTKSCKNGYKDACQVLKKYF